MSKLAGVLFHVSTLDVDRVGVPRRNLHLDSTFESNWLIELRSLEVFSKVWVKVVLASKTTVRRNVTTNRQTNLDGRLNCPLVHHRQSARQTQANWANVGVRLVAKVVAATTKHLGFGVELNVNL